MIDPIEFMNTPIIFDEPADEVQFIDGRLLNEAMDALQLVDSFTAAGSFTRSNGTMLARIYERLTKRSRRNAATPGLFSSVTYREADMERAYREGVYDAFKALQAELR